MSEKFPNLSLRNPLIRRGIAYSAAGLLLAGGVHLREAERVGAADNPAAAICTVQDSGNNVLPALGHTGEKTRDMVEQDLVQKGRSTANGIADYLADTSRSHATTYRTDEPTNPVHNAIGNDTYNVVQNSPEAWVADASVRRGEDDVLYLHIGKSDAADGSYKSAGRIEQTIRISKQRTDLINCKQDGGISLTVDDVRSAANDPASDIYTRVFGPDVTNPVATIWSGDIRDMKTDTELRNFAELFSSVLSGAQRAVGFIG